MPTIVIHSRVVPGDCVCVCVRERERESLCVYLCLRACLNVYVCVGGGGGRREASCPYANIQHYGFV